MSNSGFCLSVHSYNKKFQHCETTHHINSQNIRFLKLHILLWSNLHSFWSLVLDQLLQQILKINELCIVFDLPQNFALYTLGVVMFSFPCVILCICYSMLFTLLVFLYLTANYLYLLPSFIMLNIFIITSAILGIGYSFTLLSL